MAVKMDRERERGWWRHFAIGYRRLCSRMDGLARHVKDVGFPYAAYAVLYRAARSCSVDR